jgi:hypothetical protein
MKPKDGLIDLWPISILDFLQGAEFPTNFQIVCMASQFSKFQVKIDSAKELETSPFCIGNMDEIELDSAVRVEEIETTESPSDLQVR